MATDLAVFLHRFRPSPLAGMRGCSPTTIASSRDTFKILIGWFAGHRSVPPEKLTLDHVDAAAVTDFLGWLETGRRNSASTRNQRLAAITSFFRWLQSHEPAPIAACQEGLALPAQGKAQPGVPREGKAPAGPPPPPVPPPPPPPPPPRRSPRPGRPRGSPAAPPFGARGGVLGPRGRGGPRLRVEPPAAGRADRQGPQDPPG